MKSEYPVLPPNPTADDVAEWCRVATRLRQEEDLGDYTNLQNEVSTYEVPAGSVTLAMMADGTANRLLGYDDSGNPTEVTVSGATLSGGTLTVSGGAWVNNGYVTGQYYSTIHSRGTGTVVVSANRLYTTPFVVGETQTFDRIGVEVTTLSAGNVRLGIYNFENGIPTNLVLDCGEVSTSTTGNKIITINQTLSAGVYAFAMVFSSTPTLRAFGDINYAVLSHFYGFSSPTSGHLDTGNYASFTYGALPSTFGSVVGNSAMPAIGMRAA